MYSTTKEFYNKRGLNCVHHHPKFAVDEDQLKYGAGIYAQFAYDYLNSDAK